MGTLDRGAFFGSVRASLFGGRLTEAQVQGLDALLDAAPAALPQEHLAYALATAFHETGATMQPVTENLNYSTAARIRAVWPSRFPSEAVARPYVLNPQALANKVYGGRMGNLGADDGWTYRGRSLVQITGREMYTKASRILGVDLLTHPDLALQPKIAALILYCGMADGWFTGKRLSDYFRTGLADPYNARDIINPDKARKENGVTIGAKIAGHYQKFLLALKAAAVASPAAPPVKPSIPVIDAVPAPPDVEPVQPSGGIWSWLASLFRPRAAQAPGFIQGVPGMVSLPPISLPGLLINVIGSVVGEAVKQVAQNPNVPIEEKHAAIVAGEVAGQVVGQLQEDPRIKDLQARIEHVTSTEGFFQSRANWSMLISLVSPAVALAVGYNVRPEYQVAAAAILWFAGNGAAAYMARRARTATKPLGA